MNFRQIDLALDLARTLNYRMTAENMFISQPALSHQIKALEAEIGVALFRRSSHGVSLTPAGTIFCREMQKTVESARATISAVRNCGGLFEDVLRIGLNDRNAQRFGAILRQFTQAYPSVLADCRQMQGVGRLDAFLRHELDVVFYVNEAFPASKAIERAELFRSRIYCVMSREHPLAERRIIEPEDLSGKRLLLNDGSGPKALLHAQQDLCQRVSPTVQLCQSADTAFLWIASGQGVALLPGFWYDGSGQFAFVPYDWAETTPCSIAWYRDDHRPCLEAFVSITRAVFEQIQRENGIL
ncbi:MAG: LysR family transcriptional regulator [Christensenellaceae bacterium]|nr:LysR family transcriptional regulator [Christensenellaceae bacterium]